MLLGLTIPVFLTHCFILLIKTKSTKINPCINLVGLLSQENVHYVYKSDSAFAITLFFHGLDEVLWLFKIYIIYMHIHMCILYWHVY